MEGVNFQGARPHQLYSAEQTLIALQMKGMGAQRRTLVSRVRMSVGCQVALGTHMDVSSAAAVSTSLMRRGVNEKKHGKGEKALQWQIADNVCQWCRSSSHAQEVRKTAGG